MNTILIICVINSLVIAMSIIALVKLSKRLAVSGNDVLAAQIRGLKEQLDVVNKKLEKNESELDEIRSESNHTSDVFKRVVYGFDFIVQGCKQALNLDNIERVEDKLDSTFRDMIEHEHKEYESPDKIIVDEQTDQNMGVDNGFTDSSATENAEEDIDVETEITEKEKAE